MKDLPIITISRQAGSQGREAGHLLAKALGIPCYDYEVLSRASRESSLPTEYFEDQEKNAAAMLDRLEQGETAQIAPISMEVFQAQSKIIQEMADKGPCVIVGRCADTVLRSREHVVSVYIYASMERRIENTMKKRSVNQHMARLIIDRIDRGRSAYHSLFSHHAWADTAAYDLCVCTDKLTPEETAAVIRAFLQARDAD
jgi:cytidylate kinase